MPIQTPARQPAYPYSNNANQGSIPPTTVPSQTRKLPPGLTTDQQSEPVKAPETVTAPKKQQVSQVAAQKQQVSTTPKKQQASTVAKEEAVGGKPNSSGSGTKSLGASSLSLASGVSKSSLDSNIFLMCFSA